MHTRFLSYTFIMYVVLAGAAKADSMVAPALSSPLAYVLQHHALSCSRIGHDVLETQACLGDAGSFQAARLGLAVEMFSTVVQGAGVSDPNESIQTALYADITKFGINDALITPAMALADISSMKNSPFGGSSEFIAGRSLATLEYMFPGLLIKSGYSRESISKMSKLDVANGPQDFTAYMGTLAGGSAPINAFRIFGSESDVKPVMHKFAIDSSKVPPEQNRNLLKDFTFPLKLQTENLRAAPLGYAVAELAGRAQQTGLPVEDRFAATFGKSQGTEFVGDTPFQGAACPRCTDAGKIVPPAGMTNPFLQDSEIKLSMMQGAAGSPTTDAKPIKDAKELFSSERDASESRVTQPDAKSANAGEKPDGDQPAPKSDKNVVGSTSCNASCTAKSELLGIAGTFSDGVKTVKDTLLAEGSEKINNDMDQLENNFKDKFFGDYVQRCVNKCEGATKETKVAPVPDKPTESKEVTEPAKTPDPNKPNGTNNTVEPAKPAKTEAGSSQIDPNAQIDPQSGGTAPDPKICKPAAGPGKKRCGCRVDAAGEVGECDVPSPTTSGTTNSENGADWFFVESKTERIVLEGAPGRVGAPVPFEFPDYHGKQDISPADQSRNPPLDGPHDALIPRQPDFSGPVQPPVPMTPN